MSTFETIEQLFEDASGCNMQDCRRGMLAVDLNRAVINHNINTTKIGKPILRTAVPEVCSNYDTLLCQDRIQSQSDN